MHKKYYAKGRRVLLTLHGATLFQKQKLLLLTQTPFGRHQLSYGYGGSRISTIAEIILPYF